MANSHLSEEAVLGFEYGMVRSIYTIAFQAFTGQIVHAISSLLFCFFVNYVGSSHIDLYRLLD
jgi:hypothetical protein